MLGFSIQTIAVAFVGGVVPTLLWLWFWLNEDKKNPEPKVLILLSFILGMLAVPFVVPFEHWITALPLSPFFVFLGWAFVEELTKYGAAYLGGLHTQAEDEPIDAMIYLITAALGFAAAENTLFLLNPLLEGEFFVGVITRNIRFIGPTLLHIVSSGIIGGALALSFYKKEKVKIEYVLGGLILAVTLHAVFNFFIMQSSGSNVFIVFALIWIAVIGLMLFFERVKVLRKEKSNYQ